MTYYTCHELAEILKVSAETVRRLTARGKLGFVRVGRNIRYNEDDVKRFLLKNSHEERVSGSRKGVLRRPRASLHPQGGRICPLSGDPYDA